MAKEKKAVVDQSTEKRILAVAKKVFFTKGYAGARMQDIADEAGINKALLHYYFRSKDKLFEVIFMEAFSTFFPRIRDIIDADKPFTEKIDQFTDEYISMMMQQPFIPMFVLNEVHKNPERFFHKFIPEGKAPPIKKLAAQIAAEVKNGNIKPIDPMQLIMNLMSLCIFPFVSKPIFQAFTGISDNQLKKFMEERKTAVAAFIKAAIEV
ncbi:MAG: TetR/AcrR family transcriptional regulator [Segetibacter sp.]|nr:TetR/AcrR family transcriptional regulator [Segetibacter sp.]